MSNTMEINPIKTEKDYEETLLEIESLFGAKLGSEESDRLDILVTLVQAYEAVHYPIGLPDPVSAIEYEMDKRGLTRKDLVRSIGPSGRISEILNRQRALTMAMIRSLHAEYGIRLDILIQDYPLTGRSDKAMASSDVEVDPKGGLNEQFVFDIIQDDILVVGPAPKPNSSAPKLVPDAVQETRYLDPFDKNPKVRS